MKSYRCGQSIFTLGQINRHAFHSTFSVEIAEWEIYHYSRKHGTAQFYAHEVSLDVCTLSPLVHNIAAILDDGRLTPDERHAACVRFIKESWPVLLEHRYIKNDGLITYKAAINGRHTALPNPRNVTCVDADKICHQFGIDHETLEQIKLSPYTS